MAGYTKLFGSILDSSIWRETKETRLVWVTMMAMADKDGVVDASVPGLADRARVDMGECIKALKILESPDEWSRSKEFQGRRIEVVDGGWRLLNHAKYRAKMSAEDRREYKAKKQAEYRAKKAPRNGKPLPGENAYVQAESDGAPTEVLDGVIERNLSR